MQIVEVPHNSRDSRSNLTGLGLLLAAIIAQALSDEGVTFAVPWGPLIAFTIVAALAGIVASIMPARRAGKLDVLEALQYE